MISTNAATVLERFLRFSQIASRLAGPILMGSGIHRVDCSELGIRAILRQMDLTRGQQPAIFNLLT